MPHRILFLRIQPNVMEEVAHTIRRREQHAGAVNTSLSRTPNLLRVLHERTLVHQKPIHSDTTERRRRSRLRHDTGTVRKHEAALRLSLQRRQSPTHPTRKTIISSNGLTDHVLRRLLITRNEPPRAPLMKQHIMQSVRHSNSRPTNLTGLQTNNISMNLNVSENLLLIVTQ